MENDLFRPIQEPKKSKNKTEKSKKKKNLNAGKF